MIFGAAAPVAATVTVPVASFAALVASSAFACTAAASPPAASSLNAAIFPR